MKTTSTVPSSCPKCDETLQATTCVTSDAEPLEGDWTICMHCGEVLRFNSIGGVRCATASEYIELQPDHQWEIVKALMYVRLLKKKREGETSGG